MSQSPDVLLAMYQFIRHIGENILVGGLLGELFVIFFLEDMKQLERRGNIVCTVLIILGVGIENVAGGRSDDVIRQMRAPRSLTLAQQGRIAAKLSSFKQQSAEIKVSPVTTEGASLANQLLAALLRAHWNPFLHPPGAPFSTGSFSTSGSFANGVVIWPTRERQSIDAAQALVSALKEEGIVSYDLERPAGSQNPTFAPGCETLEPPKRSDPFCFRVLIIVGDRPPELPMQTGKPY